MPSGIKKERPDGFAEDARTMIMMELSRKYNAGHDTVRRWCKEIGVTPPTRCVHWTDDEKEKLRTLVAADHILPEIASELGRSVGAVSGKMHSMGLNLTAAALKRIADQARARQRAFHAQRPKKGMPNASKLAPVPRTDDYTRAADWLRRHTHFWPVYHRIVHGAQYAGQYVVGNLILAADEMVQLAERKGMHGAAV